MNPARIAISIGALLLIATAVACSSGTSSSDKTATAAAKGGANPTAAATKTTGATPASTAPAKSPAAGAQKQVAITAQDFSFTAASVDVSKGDTVAITFKNSGATTHTLSFFSDDAYTKPIAGADTGNVSAGATASLTVVAGDGLYYRCNIHPTQMKGEIELQ